MKKLLCLLVVVLIAVATIPAISADTELIYSVPSEYEVVIPESIGLNQDYYFTATKMNIRDDEEIYVYCYDRDGVTLTNADNDSITVVLNGNNDGTVAQFWKGDTMSRIPMVTDVFYGDDTPAGDYRGITTFIMGMRAHM